MLGQILPDSGSRISQPLLYICASTGLRLDLSPSNNNVSDNQNSKGTVPSLGSRGDRLGIRDNVGQLDVSATTGVAVGSVSSLALDIGVTCNFVMRRLCALESTLQPNLINLAEELIKAIWPSGGSGSCRVLEILIYRRGSRRQGCIVDRQCFIYLSTHNTELTILLTSELYGNLFVSHTYLLVHARLFHWLSQYCGLCI